MLWYSKVKNSVSNSTEKNIYIFTDNSYYVTLTPIFFFFKKKRVFEMRLAIEILILIG